MGDDDQITTSACPVTNQPLECRLRMNRPPSSVVDDTDHSLIIKQIGTVITIRRSVPVADGMRSPTVLIKVDERSIGPG